MERPPQHVTDSLGQTQMRAVFEPLGWTVNKVEHDYGVDFDIEIFRDHRSTGVSFKIQLKSSGNTPYSAGSDFISQEIDIDNAEYLCNELRSPVIVVHADVRSRRTFWSAPQLDVGTIRRLSEESNSATVTLRIPTANELPATAGQLVEAIAQVERLLGTRVVVSSPVPDFISSIRGHMPKEGVIQSLRDKSDALRIELAQEMLRSGRGNEALGSMESIIVDSASSTEIRFSALLMKERLSAVALARSRAPQPELAKMHSATARELQRLTKDGPQHLKFYALIAKKAAELDILVHDDWGLYLNWKITEKRRDPLWGVQLVFERTSVVRRIARTYNQCIRLVQYATNSRHRWALPEALLRIVQAVAVFIIRLRHEELGPDADRYSASAFQICKLAAWISTENEDEDGLPSAVSAALMTKQGTSGEAVDWAKEVVNSIKDDRAKQSAQLLFDRHMKRQRGEEVEGDNDATTRQVIENMAMALGIDLSNPDDPAARLVHLGIADADPGRVLKDCEHIFVSLGPQPPLATTTILANVLGLPSIASKVLHCDLHGHYVLEPALDSAYAAFKKRYCDSCPDSVPRPPAWKYSDEWQQEENLRHTVFMEDFFRRIRRRT